jgi:hypothetical protein
MRRKAGRPTCHAKGTFFRFASTTRMANIRDLRPGPVKVVTMRFRRFILDTVVPKMRVVVKVMYFRGNLVADAILETMEKRLII